MEEVRAFEARLLAECNQVEFDRDEAAPGEAPPLPPPDASAEDEARGSDEGGDDGN
jgi:hypothetical protein